MFLKSFPRVLVQLFRQVPLRNIFVIPFIVQIFGAVGVVGYLSFLNSQQTIEILVEELEQEVSERIEERLERYLEVPRITNQGFINSLEAGLDPQDFESVQRHFWQYVRTAESVNTLQFGYVQGEYLGVGRASDDSLVLKIATEKTGENEYNFDTYQTNYQGNALARIDRRPGYNLTQRDWYQKTVEAKRTRWSPIYQMFSHQTLGITLSQPVYDQEKQLIGVVGTDILLEEISQFLHQIITRDESKLENGRIFILERSGELVADSTSSQSSLSQNGQSERIQGIDSEDQIIQWATRYLQENIGSLEHINQDTQVKCYHKEQGQFLRVSLFKDDYGLDWLIVIVLPEKNFMKPIFDHNQKLIFITLIAIFIATITGSLTARWITRPLSQLNHAAEDLAEGKLEQPIPEPPQKEIAQLARNLNTMRLQLQQSFSDLNQSRVKLEITKNQLESKVEQRTTELITANRLLQKDAIIRQEIESNLQEKESYMRLILDNIPQQVFWKDTNFIFQGCNKNWAKASGFENPEDVVGKTDYDLVKDAERIKTYRDQDRCLISGEVPSFYFVEPKEKSLHSNEERWLEVCKLPIHDSRGDIIGILGVTEDITQSRQTEVDLRAEKMKSDRLLRNIFPETIAAQLKDQIKNPNDKNQEHDIKAIAEQFNPVTILFADIVGFTPLSSRLKPIELVDLLNQIFTTFDDLAEYLELEKIKTIGDAYMAASGLPYPTSDHASIMADMALTMQAVIEHLQYEEKPIQIRIGMHCGSVIAGVIGIKKFSYDLWGDTVNLASRMESSGEPGKIQVTEALYKRLKDDYILEKRGTISVKGKGKMTTYWLNGRKDEE